MLNLLSLNVLAQDKNGNSPTPTNTAVLTPEQSASAAASASSALYSSLATSAPQQPGSGESILELDLPKGHFTNTAQDPLLAMLETRAKEEIPRQVLRVLSREVSNCRKVD